MFYEENKNIMTPEHPQWNDFVQRMKNHGNYETNCSSSQTYTKKVLQTFYNIDVEGSLEYLKKNQHVYCDCGFFTEILGMDPRDPEFHWRLHKDYLAELGLVCSVEDAFLWLEPLGYSKKWIKDYVIKTVTKEAEEFYLME